MSKSQRKTLSAAEAACGLLPPPPPPPTVVRVVRYDFWHPDHDAAVREAIEAHRAAGRIVEHCMLVPDVADEDRPAFDVLTLRHQAFLTRPGEEGSPRDYWFALKDELFKTLPRHQKGQTPCLQDFS
jgi:hypothetical protein